MFTREIVSDSCEQKCSYYIGYIEQDVNMKGKGGNKNQKKGEENTEREDNSHNASNEERNKWLANNCLIRGKGIIIEKKGATTMKCVKNPTQVLYYVG